MLRIGVVIVTLLVAYVGFTSYTNSSAMNTMIEKGTEIVKTDHELEEIDIGDFKTVMVYKILPFNSKVYKVDTLGIVSIMTMNVGIMEMFTFNINPYYKDLPQLTIDYTITFNTRKLYVEIYDFMINKDTQACKDFLTLIEELNTKYSDLEDFNSKEAWYSKYLLGLIKKSGSVMQDEKLLNLFTEVINYYIEYAKKAEELNQENVKKKVELTKAFADQLVENGGIAIDNFKKTLGDEKTKDFLGNVLYGYHHIEV